ncbi:helix-turn-helix domain-containing protein [Microtetraspora fusca]|uniref:Helix-turn-helix domain-containing protein n=1 Tax=Microtetraspora fusca TaxID=1997 RepID=A0ABW6VJN1_MICFU
MPPVITVRQNGASMRALRQARGLTINALSQRLSVTCAYLSKVEREVKSPSLALAERLAGELDVELGALLREPAPTHRK